MKQEDIKCKEEIIKIQSKRIAELESYKEHEPSKKILRPVGRISQESTPLDILSLRMHLPGPSTKKKSISLNISKPSAGKYVLSGWVVVVVKQ